MNISPEKEDFGVRLRLALKMANLAHLKTSDIATRFNLRHPEEPVTQQAVHKWLNGLSVPSANKIVTLSKWLNVSEQWLKYGIDDSKSSTSLLSSLDKKLLSLFLNLSDPQKKLIIQIMQNFRK
ncbi:helix-turn-helix domain-containing protein [Volucribacter amazonae]|uniref:Transcriptional regulator n=1 Tax=Volucribacter amazonae TaxID=256731 RepID=A0A9X4SHS0_9PAST|nr:helix-turn-helix transcriptional regulator [Volucribacter amazonae]MDG6894810.1 transcriptional regulator [Volucribacter amazonae]